MTDINTPETTLTETKALMTFDRNSGSEVQYLFDPEGAESESYPRAVQLSTLAWLEMGRPSEVTVSVMPGDHMDHDHHVQAPVGRVGGFIARLLGYLIGAVLVLLAAGALGVAALGIFVLLRNLLTLAALGGS